MMESIDLLEELSEERKHRDLDLAEEIRRIIAGEEQKEEQIINNLNKPDYSTWKVDLERLDTNRIFTEQEIYNICVKYRLRFLGSELFLGQFPYSIVQEIKNLEKAYGVPVTGTKLIAPGKKFKLVDRNEDPILVASLGNGLYYYVGKWGNDLTWYRKFAVWPLQNISNYLLSLFVLCVLISILLPTSSQWNIKFYIALHMFIALFGISCFIGMSFNIHLSEQQWRSKFFN